jgi:PAS domain S-box-containing protein
MTLEKVQTRLAILIGLIVGALLVGLFVLQVVEHKRVESLLLDRSNYKQILIGDLLSLHRQHLASAAGDFASRDGISSFINHPDSSWANRYLAQTVTAFNIDGLWVLDRTGSPIYSAASADLVALNRDTTFLTALSQCAGRSDSSAAFIRTASGIFEVCTTPVTDGAVTGDPSIPCGYVAAVRIWSSEFLNEQARIAGIRLVLEPNVAQASSTARGDSTLFSRTLTDFSGLPIASLKCTGLSTYHAKIADALLRERRYLWVIGTLSLVLLGVALLVSISYPLGQLSRDRDGRPTELFQGEGTKKSLFACLGQLIKTFYRQQANLVAEMSERRRAEAALLESEQRYRLMSEQTGQLIYDWDMITDRIAISGAIEDITGYAPADYKLDNFQDWLQTVHPDDRETGISTLREICRRGGKAIFEYRQQQKDGTYISVENNGVVLLESDGTPRRMLGTVKDVTDRKRAEGARRANETLLKIQFDMGQQVDSTEEQILQYATKSAARMLNSSFGYIALVSADEAEYTACTWSNPHLARCNTADASDLQPAGPEGPWKDVVQRRAPVIANGNTPGRSETQHHLGVPILDGDKTVLVGGVSDELVTYDDTDVQQMTELLSHLWSILQRKRAEERRNASENLYRAIFDSANDAIFLMSGDIFVDCNAKTLEFFGCARHQIIGQPPYRYSPECQPDGRLSAEKAAEKINSALAGQPQFFEWLHCKFDGSPIETEVSLNRFEVTGNVMILAVVRDISERKAAERKLEQTQSLLNAAFAQSPYGILVASAPDVVIEYANPGSKECRVFNTIKQTGINWLEHTGQWSIFRSDGVTPMTPDELPLAQAIRHGVISSGVEVLVDDGPNGYFWFTISASPIRSKDGTIIAGVSMIQDITSQKIAQEQRTQLEEKLQRAKRMESLGVLAGGVAHDLNNMLGPVVGYSELLLRQLESQPKLADKAGKIMKAARDAADVIQDLLTLARRGRYEMTPLDLNDVIRTYFESPSFAGLKARHPLISIEVALTENPMPVCGSGAHLSKVIMNIAANACEAMPQGGTLQVRTGIRRVDALLTGHAKFIPGDFVVLTVKDSGVGIPEDDISKIFEPYYSKKQMGQSGTGLGLSVVYGVVKDHRGYYDVLSRIGEGTEFIFYFPICGEYMGTAVKHQASRGGIERILVVDDYQEQRDLAKEILASLGYQVNVAENGRKALAYLQVQAADLVLLDMIMEPDFDGLDTFREIRKILPHQKIIVVSGFSASERVQEMQRAGAGPYVRKPFTIDSIARAVRSILDEKPAPTLEPADTRT